MNLAILPFAYKQNSLETAAAIKDISSNTNIRLIGSETWNNISQTWFEMQPVLLNI